ncbi:DUF547 domain-containing protein [bacterium]|nr:DUF547 domain-containing protein [bacterium]
MRSALSGSAAGEIQSWIAALGPWGPLALGVIYVIGTIFMVPASVLTIAAGALFGLGLGTVTVSVASTLGAALAFLIGRYLARGSVERAIQSRPKLKALDKAIDEGGWKIVAMLRLSPAVPFSLQNYFYGLTSIRFWPCVLTSWVAMLPGTFLYVYIGQAAGSVASGRGKSPMEWGLLVVGLLATVAITVYLTRLARRRLAEISPTVETEASHSSAALPSVTGSIRNTATLAVAALILVFGAIIQAKSGGLGHIIVAMFGPPQVVLAEKYADISSLATFDHSSFDALLHRHVSEGGWVDYDRLKEERALLQAYLETLATAPLDELGRDEKLALMINAYNAFTLQLIVEHYPLASIRDIPEDRRWDDVRWNLAGNMMSLNELEHERIRPNFREPRIHFALVCAAVGCPPLRAEAYSGTRIEEQLQAQADYVHKNPRWFQLHEDESKLALTRLYEWYGGDFEQVADSVLKYAARFAPKLDALLACGKQPAITWLEYDWSLNDTANRR